jgi:hypothetical protein
MVRCGALLSSLLLGLLAAGCATVEVVDPPTALNGRELNTALNLYGQWDERLTVNNEPQYLWRRAVVSEGQPYVCELRVVVSLRNIIRAVSMEGFPEACALFSVQYKSTTDQTRTDDQGKSGQAPKPARRYRPVGQ